MLTCLGSYQGCLSELPSMLLFVLHLLHNIQQKYLKILIYIYIYIFLNIKNKKIN